jgi:predicted phosphodiesterase
LSDLHLDVNARTPFVLPEPRPAHDVVVIAGDVVEGIVRGIEWIVSVGLNARPVVLIAGNHEFYGFDHDAERARGRVAAGRHAHVHLLERATLVIGDVRFCAATLWTDYDLTGDRAGSLAMANRVISDHRVIADGPHLFSAERAREEHLISHAWLTAVLAEPWPGRTVVVTHHAPSAKSLSGRFAGHPANAAFASDLDDLVAQADVWIHGHTHRATDYRLGRCRVINNPRGYVPRESTGFRADFVVDI